MNTSHRLNTTAADVRVEVFARRATAERPFDIWNADASQLRQRLAMTESAAANALQLLGEIKTRVEAHALLMAHKQPANLAEVHELTRDASGPLRAILSTSGRKF